MLAPAEEGEIGERPGKAVRARKNGLGSAPLASRMKSWCRLRYSSIRLLAADLGLVSLDPACKSFGVGDSSNRSSQRWARSVAESPY